MCYPFLVFVTPELPRNWQYYAALKEFPFTNRQLRSWSKLRAFWSVKRSDSLPHCKFQADMTSEINKNNKNNLIHMSFGVLSGVVNPGPQTRCLCSVALWCFCQLSARLCMSPRHRSGRHSSAPSACAVTNKPFCGGTSRKPWHVSSIITGMMKRIYIYTHTVVLLQIADLRHTPKQGLIDPIMSRCSGPDKEMPKSIKQSPFSNESRSKYGHGFTDCLQVPRGRPCVPSRQTKMLHKVCSCQTTLVGNL